MKESMVTKVEQQSARERATRDNAQDHSTEDGAQ